MFDRLVESTRNKQRSRSGRFLFLTGLIYVAIATMASAHTAAHTTRHAARVRSTLCARMAVRSIAMTASMKTKGNSR